MHKAIVRILRGDRGNHVCTDNPFYVVVFIELAYLRRTSKLLYAVCEKNEHGLHSIISLGAQEIYQDSLATPAHSLRVLTQRNH